ncbi:MAG: TerC family protein [Acetobacteraceae bacterium]|nr:TerC family protein [Acetobacteraceae bacterium]
MEAFLSAEWLGKPAWMWVGIFTFVFVLLVLDLGVLNRKAKVIEARQSLMLAGMYMCIGLGFGGFVWWQLGPTSGMEYITGYIVEWSLAMDNLFVIAMIFTYLHIPREYQHRVLFWGIIGVIVLRGIMIGFGAALVVNFSWVLYLFAAFLIFTGIKMLTAGDKEEDIGENPLLKFLRRHLRVTEGVRGHRFFVRETDPKTGKVALFATPLFLALCLVEVADIIFAVDSVPAIFAITTDVYIVYTSNIFAILGLRALFFALSAMMHRFAYLKQALAFLLMFIGSKIFLADLLGLEKFPAEISLSVTFAILAAGVAWSLFKTRGERAPEQLRGQA